MFGFGNLRTFLLRCRYSSRAPQHHSKNPQPTNKTPQQEFPPFSTPNLTSITTFPSSQMESVASNSPSPDHHQPRPRFNPSQPIADRITRALQHPLRLLHRLNPKFFVLGATGNVYTVTLSTAPTCTCPDRLTPCKHILFTFIRVLGTALDDICIRRRTLRPCQLNRLLTTPTSPDALAAACIRDRFHQLYSQQSVRDSQPTIEVEEGAACPVCLDDMRRGERIVACGTCRNPLHQKCMLMWKRSKRKRSANCVICRARWSNRMDQENYMNLSAYISGGADTVDNCEEQCGAISTVSSTSMHGNSNKVPYNHSVLYLESPVTSDLP